MGWLNGVGTGLMGRGLCLCLGSAVPGQETVRPSDMPGFVQVHTCRACALLDRRQR